jgi:hypothetical protein
MMKLIDVVNENISSNLLVVDIQPAYHRWCSAVSPRIMQLLNTHTGKKYCLYNAEGLTTDTEDSIVDYYLENGLKQEKLDDIIFVEKAYGYFRDWMDNDVTERIIIKTIRAMVQNRVNNSTDLDVNTVLTQQEQERGLKLWGINWEDNGIYMPDFMPISLLKQMSPFLMCGGARERCLKEIELLCNAFNIKYKRIDSLIYD